MAIGGALVLMMGSAFLSWSWRNETKYNFQVRFEQVVDFGFQAFASNDWYNAEGILSSLFDKYGNELNLFRKMDRCRQLKARSLYGYLLFHKGDFKKSERVWRPLFKSLKSMNEFVSSGKSQQRVLLFYLTDLFELKKSQEILKIFNLCYDDCGNPSEILQKFGDSPLMRVMAGEFFYRSALYEKVTAVLEALYKNPSLAAELDERQKAMVVWFYAKSLICKGNEVLTEDENDVASNIIAQFFDENMKATKLFNDLGEEDQICCRITYAQLLLKTDDHEKIFKLLNIFFDNSGQMLLKLKNPSDEATIRDIYGYVLCKCGKYKEAERVWSSLFKKKNEELMKKEDSDESKLLSALCKNIRRLSF